MMNQLAIIPVLIALTSFSDEAPRPAPVPFSPQEVVTLPQSMDAVVTHAKTLTAELPTPPPQLWDVSFSMNQSPNHDQVAFYQLHYGPTNGVFENAVPVGLNTNFTVYGLPLPSKFAASAVATNGETSDLSNVVVLSTKPAKHIYARTNDSLTSTNWKFAGTVAIGDFQGSGFWRLEAKATNIIVEVK